MEGELTRLDHLGIAVRSLSQGTAFWTQGLGLEVEAVEEIAGERVRAAFIPVGPCRVELLEASAPDSVIARFVEKRGEGLHHVCFAVDDLDAALARLRACGYRLIGAAPRPGAEGSQVAFVHPGSAGGVLIELKQVRETVDKS